MFMIIATDHKLTAEGEEDMKWTTNSMHSASLDTSTATITTLNRCSCAWGAGLCRGTDSDRPNLPYIDALMSETLRCNCVVPLGLPHRGTQEDVYNGAPIPAGTLVFGNAWNMAHNPTHYPNPDVFDPTRFLGPTPAPDPRAYVFGFGHRKCPCQHIIESNLWLLLASLLHSFDILPGLDDEG
jgi:cytochrome P450